jgi:hypothetical protein
VNFFSQRLVLTAFSTVLDKLNTEILNQEDNYQENGEVVIDMAALRELSNEHVREHLVLLLRESGWNAHFNSSNSGDWLILY